MPSLQETIDTLIADRVASGGVNKAKGDEGEFEFDSIRDLAEARERLAKAIKIEGSSKLIRPLVTRVSDPREP